MTPVAAVFLRELKLRLRGGGWAATVGLFSISAGLAPLALGRDAAFLAATAPPLLWLTAALTLLIGLDGLFDDDLRSGAFAIYRLSSPPFALIIAVKMLAGWIAACLPLVCVAPILLTAFGVERPILGALGFLAGTPALALLAGAVAALCAGLRRGTSLLVFLALPLFGPALVFGPQTAGPEPLVPFLILGAYSLQALAVCPFVAAAAIRTQMA
jgi:heme exporter protein B